MCHQVGYSIKILNDLEVYFEASLKTTSPTNVPPTLWPRTLFPPRTIAIHIVYTPHRKLLSMEERPVSSSSRGHQISTFEPDFPPQGCWPAAAPASPGAWSSSSEVRDCPAIPLHYQSHYDCCSKPCNVTGLGLDAGIALPCRSDRASTDPFVEHPKNPPKT